MESDRLFELRRRTFDTPHFRGIEFIEVEAKSIINHVPGNYLPFNWTINVYRGCSHACAYCVVGETPILMADGRTKPLAEIEVGDLIYGTEVPGNYRRFVTTMVLAHWKTRKPAYRVTLEDGTELITSGDHRFLSDRGWKHVTGAEQGRRRRPHLTTNNKLMGTGAFADAPSDGIEYRSGYLCGLIRGDGSIWSSPYSRSDGSIGAVHGFRLALVDLEALRRGREYLAEFGVDTTEFQFQAAAGARKEIMAIRSQSRGLVETIRQVIRWPLYPSAEWFKGFLAGIFDAEGSFSNGILRICNTDPEIIGHIETGLRTLGFSFALETQARAKPLTYVRLRRGLREKLRFFHTVDPAITRKRTIEGTAIKSNAPLRVASIEPLNKRLRMYDITTGTGDFIANGVVSHNCFARVTHTYMDMDAGRDFESKIVVKVNAPQLLRKELRAKRWKGESIAMGTATDPYQRAEGRYRLTRGIVETLTEVRNPFSILTKGTLILRDLDLLVAAADVTEVSTALSIGTVDEDVWRRSEPGTPHPRKRMEAVAKLNDAGIPCGVMIAPVLPGISDSEDQLRAVIEAALDAGATHVSPILLHLRPGVKEVYMRWLEDNYPDLVPRYKAMYSTAYASPSDRKSFGARFSELRESFGPRRRRSPPVRDGARVARRSRVVAAQIRRDRAALETEQLKLL
jgi:DNA repair photolyase